MDNSVKLDGFDYVGYCIRPPSESNSILLQATLGCSHNKCSFCSSYKDKSFTIKKRSIWEKDLLFAQKYCKHQNRLFVMDGDALVMPKKYWEWLLKKINKKLPWVDRVGTYANSKAVKLKTIDDLILLRKMKLGIIYYGLESGHSEVLRSINKKATPEDHIEQCQKIKKAGIKLSVTVLLGIGGTEKSLKHAQETGKILSKINPDYIGALTLMIIPGTPLDKKNKEGSFSLPKPSEMLLELREMIANTNITNGLFFANHASNYLTIKANLPQDKKRTINSINNALKGQTKLKPEWMRAL